CAAVRRGPVAGTSRCPCRARGSAQPKAGIGLMSAAGAGTTRPAPPRGGAVNRAGRRSGGVVLEFLHRDAGAEHVLVAVDVVHARDRRPVLLLLQRRQREGGQLAGVTVLPLAAGDL